MTDSTSSNLTGKPEVVPLRRMASLPFIGDAIDRQDAELEAVVRTCQKIYRVLYGDDAAAAWREAILKRFDSPKVRAALDETV